MAHLHISSCISRNIRRSPIAMIVAVTLISAGCGSGGLSSAPQSTDPALAVLHGVAIDPATSDQFAGTALIGLVNDVVMVRLIMGGSGYDSPEEITQVTIEVDGKNHTCWHFSSEGLLAKDTSRQSELLAVTFTSPEKMVAVASACCRYLIASPKLFCRRHPL